MSSISTSPRLPTASPASLPPTSALRGESPKRDKGAAGTLLEYWGDLGRNAASVSRHFGHAVHDFQYGKAAGTLWHADWLRAPANTFKLLAYSRGPYAERLARYPLARVMMDPDYKTQMVGRMGTQFGVGIGYGVSALILGMNRSMDASQGLLAADLVRGLEIMLHQSSSLWRGSINDRTRAQRESAERDPAAEQAHGRIKIPRHRIVCALDTAWVAEVACCAALVGVALCRQAAWMSVRGLIVMLALIRAARVICSQAQYAQFDSLRETIHDGDTRAIITRNRELLRNTEQVVGFAINYSAGVLVQTLPTMVPCPALVPVFVGLLGTSIVISFLSKQPARRYYRERNLPKPHDD